MYCQTKCPDLTTLLASEGYLFFGTVFSQFDISELTKFSCIYVKTFLPCWYLLDLRRHDIYLLRDKLIIVPYSITWYSNFG